MPKNPAENFNSAPVKEVGMKTTGVSKVIRKVGREEKGLKVILLGASNCGKSSLVVKFCDGTFQDNGLGPTIGVNKRFESLKIDDEPIVLEIVDPVGQERFHSFTKQFFREALGAIFVFDLSDPKSVDDLQRFFDTFR
jgi:small GTP-binding protein